MKIHFFKFVTIGSFSLLTVLAASSLAFGYAVKHNETLSEIAQKSFSGPVWGMNGSLAKILALNPSIKNPDFILPNQIIKINDNHAITQQDPPKSTRSIAEAIAEPQSTKSINSEKSVSFEEHSILSVAPTFAFSRISATDKTSGANSTLGSALNLGAKIEWRQFWSENFQTALLFSGESQSYSTTSTQTLDHSSFFLGSVGIEGRWGKELSPQIISHLKFMQSPFIRGESQTANTLDVVTIPALGIGAQIPIYHSKVFLMSAEVMGDYLAPSSQSSYLVNSGYGVEGKLSLSQHTKADTTKKIEGSLFVKYLNQNTSITTENNLEIGAMLQFNFDLFAEEKTKGQMR